MKPQIGFKEYCEDYKTELETYYLEIDDNFYNQSFESFCKKS